MADNNNSSLSDDHQHEEINSHILGSGSTTTTTTTAATAATAVMSTNVHPLQDVDLSATATEDAENNTKISKISKTKSKQNWVRFDDEVNEMHDNKNNNNNNSSNKNNQNISSIDGSTNATTAGAVATTSTKENQLSAILPPPPPSQKATTHTQSRTPTERIQKQLQQQQQLAVNAPPVQRSTPDVAPAVLTTESTHVNLNASGKLQQQHHPQHQPQQQQQHQQQQQQQYKPKTTNVLSATSASTTAAIGNTQHFPHHSNNNGTTTSGIAIHKTTSAAATANVTIPIESVPPMRTIELSTGRIREGFANGDVIVTLLPANTKWPWITPAVFRPELVPEELMAQGLTLTVEEYVNAMETLVNDYRFTVYNICYKRILVVWILFAFTVLLTLLFSGLQGVALFALGVGWLFLNAAAIFLCMWVKLRLSRGLEKCLARVNKQLMKHKILLILDDRGRISCHKVNLCFLYFDATQCVNFLNEFLEHTEQNGGEAIKAGWEAKLDIDMNDIVIQGNNPVRVSRKQAVAQELFLSYLQRWGKDFLRRRLDWTVQEAGVHETPRHLQSSICPCQYEEEVLRNKIKMHLKGRQCCGINCIGCWL